MASTVADYHIMRDTPKTLKGSVASGDTWSKTFTLSKHLQIHQHSILQWYYVGNSDTDIKYRFTINGKTIRTHRIIGNVYGTAHEVFRHTTISGQKTAILKDEAQNTLRVSIVGPQKVGTMTVGDIVLWYQRKA